MREIPDFHHYRADQSAAFDRVARCERALIDILLTSRLTDSERESSQAFELKHHHSVGQFARLLAQRRGLPADECTVGGLLHDFHVIESGHYEDHAHRGAPRATQLLRELGGFTEPELDRIYSLVYNHSDKHIWSDDPFAEFGKDVDTLDCFLYPDAFGFYLKHKSLFSFSHYLRRAKRVWRELGVPPPPQLSLLDGYSVGWFDHTVEVSRSEAALALDAASRGNAGLALPPFELHSTDRGLVLSGNRDAWAQFGAEAPRERDDDADFLSAALHTARVVSPSQSSAKPPPLTRVGRSLPSSRDALAALIDTESRILVWPALGGYEVLHASSPRALARRAELYGVSPEPSSL